MNQAEDAAPATTPETASSRDELLDIRQLSRRVRNNLAGRPAKKKLLRKVLIERRNGQQQVSIL
jgi:hypothetical protein